MEILYKNGCVDDELIDVNVVCMLQWFGPFNDVDDCRQWTQTHNVKAREFNFYIVWGKKPGRGVRHYTLYCGITEQKNICDRFKEKHPANNLIVKEIWLARFSNAKLRKLTPDGRLKQGMRQYIECVEHGLINYWERYTTCPR